MEKIIKEPYFELQLCHPTKHFLVDVVVEGEVVHKITNFMHFSKEIGYPDLSDKVFANKGDSGQEAVLFAKARQMESAENTVANDLEAASNVCFQFRVAKYLFKNSELFKEKYADYYAGLIGSCKSYSKVNSAKCINCCMHPNYNGGAIA